MAPTHVPAILCLLTAAFVSGQQHVEVTPREAVIVKGANVSMVCKVAYAIDSCRIRVAGQTRNMRPDRDLDANLKYHGNGLDKGECGVMILSADEGMNGNITCSVPSQSSSLETEGFMRLIIAKPPGQPILLVSPGSISSSVFRAGDRMQAYCEVPHGRPHAKIRWYLGDNPLQDGLHQVVIRDEPNSDLTTVSQNVTRAAAADDDGRTLTCVAEHEALPAPYRALRQLAVQYPPQRPEAGPITIFGVKLREDGLLNVTVRANPAPHAVWTIGSVHLNSGETDADDKYEALHLQPLGNGYYLASMLIHNVEKSDVDRIYQLSVQNLHGVEEFTVRISTSEEPEAVPLDTGSIVGIVVALLVVLIAVFLIIFARATNRWCFADARNAAESRPRSSGESSDTESAVGGGAKAERGRGRLAELSRALPALRAVLPARGARRDKVKAQPEPDAHARPAGADEEKPLQEGEKKSVVYAELALAAPPALPKQSPDAAEYAEIVYTNPPAGGAPAPVTAPVAAPVTAPAAPDAPKKD